MTEQTGKQTNIQKLKKMLRNLLPSKTITYSRLDAGKIAKKLSSARKRDATKEYRDALREGYEYFGKALPKRKETRKVPVPKDNEYGIGWGE